MEFMTCHPERLTMPLNHAPPTVIPCGSVASSGTLGPGLYRFHTNDDARTPVVPLRPPTGEAESLVGWLAERFGPLPMTMSSWLPL